MSHERAKVVLLHKLAQGRHVIHVKVFCLATARVARKERKGIGANGQRRLPHRPIALRRRKMTPDRQHLQLPLISCGEIRSIGALFWRKQTVFHRQVIKGASEMWAARHHGRRRHDPLRVSAKS